MSKTEIIKTLLDDPKVKCVKIEFKSTSGDKGEIHIHNIDAFFDYPAFRDNLKLLDVIYYPVKDIGVGDLVWCKDESIIGEVECIDIYTLIKHKNEDGVFTAHVCDQSGLTLLKKAKSL